jgi:hypothetical protein
MARTAESAVQRLQVGLLGLLAVLIFVSIASMVRDRADQQDKLATAAERQSGAPKVDDKAVTDEPLVELGVTPVVPEQPAKQTAPKPAQQR